MSEWKEYRLGDVGKIVTGKTPSTKVSSYYDGSIHFVSPADLNNCNKEILSTAKTISSSGLMTIKGSILPKRAICVSCIGNLGYVGITKMECASNQQINSIIVDESYFDIDFIYYTIKWLWRYFKSQENQSTTISIINKSTFANIKFSAPDINLQKKIAILLSGIDSKIENNRKICANLEAQAQALFKHWFIDFAPFKDGKFVESELGMIPEGWRVGTFGEIAELIKPSIKPRENVVYSHYSIPSFDDNQTPSNDYGESIKSNKFAIHDSVTMLSKLNPDHKRIWYVDKVERNAVCSTEFLPFYAKDKEQSVFVYCYLNCTQNYREIANGAKGTTNSHQRIDANAIVSRKIAYDSEAISQFSVLVRDFMKQKDIAVHENSRLAELRNTLLPKLMSGEIKV